MNEEELRRNPRLGGYVVQNLNSEPQLLLGEAEYDGVGICASINYLPGLSRCCDRLGAC